VRLAKAEALGNDFLVVVDPRDVERLDATGARALADRRRGLGADGVIGLDGEDRLVLYNADGSRAEMSGNGLRCLGQVLCEVRGLTELTVATERGPRTYRRLERSGVVAIGETTMGEVRLLREGERLLVDVGNPHEVRFVEESVLDDLDLVELGARAQAEVPGGVNVEWVARAGPASLRLRVFERGVGETEACGTGSTAAAVAAVHSGLIDAGLVDVHNPGGVLSVDTEGPEPRLRGPSRIVGWIEVPEETIAR